jgi:hypothetical protein
MQPGHEFYVPSVEEIVQPMEDKILHHLGKNARFTRVLKSATVIAAGVFTINIQVPDGFLWDLRWFQTDNAHPVNLYLNNANPLNFIAQTTNAGAVAPVTFPAKTYVIHSGETLVLSNGDAASTVGGNVNVALGIIEVPVMHEAQLLL